MTQLKQCYRVLYWGGGFSAFVEYVITSIHLKNLTDVNQYQSLTVMILIIMMIDKNMISTDTESSL